MFLTREHIAKRIAAEIKTGDYVNLGIGIPTLVANYIPDNYHVVLQSENGLLGIGPYPRTEAAIDPDLINAGKESITAIKGAAYLSSEESFAMIRGGHIHLAVLGAFQVDQLGNIASWMVPGKIVKGMGGAMDLVTGAQRIIVAMTQTDKNGNSKLLPSCTFPLTGLHCVDEIVTEMGMFRVKDGAFHLIEKAKDVPLSLIQASTAGTLHIAEPLKIMSFDD